MVNSEISVLFLSLSDVLEVDVTLRDAVEIVETSLREHGEKRVENPPKLPIHPLSEAFINAMPAFLPGQKICGLKWVAGFPTNVPKDLPTITAVIVLNDPETGMPLAFMDGTYITALRTVAVSAVTAKHLCNPDATVMGLVGCGVQGKYHAVALKQIIPAISTIKIHDQYEPSVRSFLEDIRPRLPGVTISVHSCPEETIRGVDVVVTATGKLLAPIYKNKWVKEGALVLPVHTLGWDPSTASQMDKLVTDDWEQFRTVGDKAYQPLPEKPHAETGEIVAGLKTGRENRTERIVCFNKGLAVHDVMMANAIYQKAQRRHIGKRLCIQESGQQLPMLEI